MCALKTHQSRRDQNDKLKQMDSWRHRQNYIERLTIKRVYPSILTFVYLQCTERADTECFYLKFTECFCRLQITEERKKQARKQEISIGFTSPFPLHISTNILVSCVVERYPADPNPITVLMSCVFATKSTLDVYIKPLNTTAV